VFNIFHNRRRKGKEDALFAAVVSDASLVGHAAIGLPLPYRFSD